MLRQEFPALGDMIDAADKLALRELTVLAAEKVDLRRRLAELQSKIDGLKESRSR